LRARVRQVEAELRSSTGKISSLQARLRTLQEQAEALTQALHEARRAGKRQAAPPAQAKAHARAPGTGTQVGQGLWAARPTHRPAGGPDRRRAPSALAARVSAVGNHLPHSALGYQAPAEFAPLSVHRSPEPYSHKTWHKNRGQAICGLSVAGRPGAGGLTEGGQTAKFVCFAAPLVGRASGMRWGVGEALHGQSVRWSGMRGDGEAHRVADTSQRRPPWKSSSKRPLRK